jgi:hypothetical protein
MASPLEPCLRLRHLKPRSVLGHGLECAAATVPDAARHRQDRRVIKVSEPPPHDRLAAELGHATPAARSTYADTALVAAPWRRETKRRQ